MKIYKVVLTNQSGTKSNINFYRTFFRLSLWNLIDKILKDVEKKSKDENEEWAIKDIKRIK